MQGVHWVQGQTLVRELRSHMCGQKLTKKLFLQKKSLGEKIHWDLKNEKLLDCAHLSQGGGPGLLPVLLPPWGSLAGFLPFVAGHVEFSCMMESMWDTENHLQKNKTPHYSSSLSNRNMEISAFYFIKS